MCIDALCARRALGGFGDSGGLTSNGELPDAEPVQLKTESELKAKMASIAKDLDLKVDWESRCKVGCELVHSALLLSSPCADS